MNEILNWVINGLVNNWQNWATHTLLWLLAGGAAWFVIEVQKVRKQWDDDSVIQRFALLVSGLGTLADYVLRNFPTHFMHAQNPAWLGAIIAGLFTTVTFIHHLKLAQLANKLVSIFQPYFAAVKELKTAKATAAQPSGVPTDSFD